MIIEHRRARDGGLVLSVKLGEQVVHQDVVAIASASDRDRFVAALCKGRPGIDPQLLKQLLLDIAADEERKRAGPAGRTRPPPRQLVARYAPFPTDLLPKKVARFVRKAAGAVGCDEAFVALPLLAGLASAVGTTRRIILKSTWKEYCILWSVVVAESGSKKSPPFDLALEPLHQLQNHAFRSWQQRLQDYEQQQLEYDRQVVQYRRSKGITEMPPKPEKPLPEHLLVQDTTVEALAPILASSPRGVLLARDELSGWFGGFNQYKAGHGGDVAHWLEMFRGGPLKVDRKGAGTVCVAAAAVCVAGTIQPGVLGRSLGREHFENGMAPRLLVAYPPRRKIGWTEEEVDRETATAVAQVYARLRDLKFYVDYDGEQSPVDVPLTPAAKQAWIRFVNEHAEEQFAMGGGDLAAAWSKLEGYAARLALLVHLVRQAEGELPPDGPAGPKPVDENSVAAGVGLARWFGREAERVYAALNESEDERRLRELEERIRGLGGQVSPRQMIQLWRKYRDDPGAAEADLQALVNVGRGRWEFPAPGPKGGHPTRLFALSDASNSDNANVTPVAGPVAGSIAGVGATVAPPADEGQTGVIEV
jgi:hypothetical protein